MGAALAPRPSNPARSRSRKTASQCCVRSRRATMTKRVAAFCAALLSFVVFLIVALWGATFRNRRQHSRARSLPGSTAPINVRISNPHFYPITVSNLTVRIASITPAHKGADLLAQQLHAAPGGNVHRAPRRVLHGQPERHRAVEGRMAVAARSGRVVATRERLPGREVTSRVHRQRTAGGPE